MHLSLKLSSLKVTSMNSFVVAKVHQHDRHAIVARMQIKIKNQGGFIMRINNNITAMNAYRNLTSVNETVDILGIKKMSADDFANMTLDKLFSGKEIKGAKENIDSNRVQEKSVVKKMKVS